MTSAELRHKIDQKLANLTVEELALVDKLLLNLKIHFDLQHSNQVKQVSQNDNDPLALLRDSDFVGCFSDSSDLAEKSEEIIHSILAEKYPV